MSVCNIIRFAIMKDNDECDESELEIVIPSIYVYSKSMSIANNGKN